MTVESPPQRRLRPLTAAEFAAFDHVERRTRERARIVVVPWLPGTFAAMTLGRFVLLARKQRDDGTSTLLAHELVHVEQWWQQGSIRFAFRYLSNFISEFRHRRNWMGSYRALEAEVEARERTRQWWQRHDESAVG